MAPGTRTGSFLILSKALMLPRRARLKMAPKTPRPTPEGEEKREERERWNVDVLDV